MHTGQILAVLLSAFIYFTKLIGIRSTKTCIAVLALRCQIIDVRVEDAEQIGLSTFSLWEPPAMLGTYNAIIQSQANSGNLTTATALVLNPDPIAFLDPPVRSCFNRHLNLWLRMKLAARQMRMAMLRMEEFKGAGACREDQWVFFRKLRIRDR